MTRELAFDTGWQLETTLSLSWFLSWSGLYDASVDFMVYSLLGIFHAWNLSTWVLGVGMTRFLIHRSTRFKVKNASLLPNYFEITCLESRLIEFKHKENKFFTASETIQVLVREVSEKKWRGVMQWLILLKYVFYLGISPESPKTFFMLLWQEYIISALFVSYVWLKSQLKLT